MLVIIIFLFNQETHKVEDVTQDLEITRQSLDKSLHDKVGSLYKYINRQLHDGMGWGIYVNKNARRNVKARPHGGKN